MQTGPIDCFLYDDMMIRFFTSFYFFYYLLYVSVDWRRKIGILSKRQNNSFFYLSTGLGRIWLAAFVFIYLCIARIFVTHTK